MSRRSSSFLQGREDVFDYSAFFGRLDSSFRLEPARGQEGKGNVTGYAITDHAAPLSVTPGDPLFVNQWHLNGAGGVNVQGVWDDWRGAGIKIGMIDDGMDYNHADLKNHYDGSIDYDSGNGSGDGAHKTSSDKHGTTTAGVAGAEGDNGLGVTGVAYEATLSSFRINFGANITDAQLATLFSKQAQVDVSSNSWGFNGFFADNLNTVYPTARGALIDAVTNGRAGLGTNFVFAAGNGRQSGDNTNYHNLQNSQYVISVAATDETGKYAYFSTPGASVLVSAPGVNIVSTDRAGSAGYVSGDYVSGLAGTSYSAPIVSGVVALMLDANPSLGYRDVQEILAYSARNSAPDGAGWQINGAGNWNGGGLHFSHDYGYGLVNAHDAVRLAETWRAQSTAVNMESVSSGLLSVNAAIPDNNAAGVSRSVTFSGTDLTIDHVEIDLNIAHSWIGDLKVFLTSPDGTRTMLINRPGINPDNPSGFGSAADDVRFTLMSNAFWGEQADGVWTLTIADAAQSYTGTLQNWTLRAYGDTGVNHDTYVYTDEFSTVANAARTQLVDSNGGVDTINASAVTGNTSLNLSAGATSIIDGVSMAIALGTIIENAFLGDGNDSVIGNALANLIDGGRGNDIIEGAGGDDVLRGGAGIDTARYLGVFVDYLVQVLDAVTLAVQDMVAADGDEGADTLTAFEKFLFGGETYVFNGTGLVLESSLPNQAPDAVGDAASVTAGQSVTVNVLANDTDADGDTLTVLGIAGAPANGSVTLNANQTITYTPQADWFGSDSFSYRVSDGQGGEDIAQVAVTVNQEAAKTLTGNNSANVFTGGTGNDTINGNGGNDTLFGKAGNDAIDGGSGNDSIDGGSGNDTIRGGAGNDTMRGGAGNDTLYSDGGNDTFIGGAGADILNAGGNRDTFVFEALGDAGDSVNGFKRGGVNPDVLDFRPLFDSLGYAGANPVADGYMQIVKTGGDLIVKIDADGPGGMGPVDMVTLKAVSFSTLAAGTDYLVQ